MERHIHVADCSIYCYNKTSGNAISALFCTESSLTLSSFSIFKKLAMNTLSKSSSVALAIALGFSMLATSTSLNAQSNQSDYAGSERSISAGETKPAAKPTLSFGESVKRKAVEQDTAKTITGIKQSEIKAPVSKTASDAGVTKTSANTKWVKDSESGKSTSTKVLVKETTGFKVETAKNNVATFPIKSNDIIDGDDNGAKSDVIKIADGKNDEVVPALNNRVAAPASEVEMKTVVTPVTVVKYENASPAGKVKVEIQPKPSAPVQIATMVEQHEVKGAAPANEKSR